MGFAQKKTDVPFNYADFLKWPEEERWELIDGIAYNMSPAPSRAHQEIVRELVVHIGTYLKGKPCRLFSAPFDVRLDDSELRNEEQIRTVVQPDIVIVCNEKKLDDRGCKGAPDLVIEVISRESASRDMKQKLSLYEKYGVKEYWIISPFEQIIWVYTYDQNIGLYGRPAIYSEDDVITSYILETLKLSVKDVFAFL
jgi:Uma2 family endonuclease